MNRSHALIFAALAGKSQHMFGRPSTFFGRLASGRRGARIACAAVACFSIAAAASSAAPSAEETEFFEKKVRPLLVEKCQKCHGPERHKGDLRLDSRAGLVKGGESGPVIVSGRPEKSELVRAINYEADGFQMPPTGKLDAESIAILTRWVALGAPWPDSPVEADSAPADSAGKQPAFDFAQRAQQWCFQPLRIEKPPAPASPARDSAVTPANPVDRFIEDKLQEAKIRSAPPADRRTLLRRVTFDLTGLPPTPAEVDQFLADKSADAYERVVDRLLASPRYGVCWARHWLDLVRYAETYGHEFDFEIPSAWPYRDYVVRALNGDVPYDQFATEHIAGDLLTPPRRNPRDGSNESVIGTAFWWFGQAKHSPVDLRAEECDTVDNQIDVFGKTFLGLSIACARCHDHKFDAIRAKDYYALAGFLQSSRQQIVEIENDLPVVRFKAWRRAHEGELVSLVAERLASRVDAGLTSPALRNPLPARPEDLRARAIRFEDFSGPNYGDWRVSGSAFGDRPSRAGDFAVGTTAEHPIADVASHGWAHSGLVSSKLHGALRSKTFTIERPFIHYRAFRHGPRATHGRTFKTGQLNLVVDGFQIIRDPLYGQLSIAVKNDAPARWHTQNVSKFVGSRGYIEILDEDDGWIAVDSILFTDDSRPPREWAADSAAGDPAIDKDLLNETLTWWKSGRLATDVHGSQRAELLAGLLRQPIRPQAGPIDERLQRLLDEWHQHEATIAPRSTVIAMVDGSAENEHELIRGNPRKPGEEVPRRFLEVFGGRAIPSSEPGSGRLQLAREMFGPASPLVARVLVNRLWRHHFGRGLAMPPDDFGRMGQAPTHPQLLDYLAGEMLRRGWSIKQLQRLMVLSSAYRRSSRAADRQCEAADPENRLFHRMSVKRLEGEAIRDALLAVAGRLDERMEGPSVPVHLTEFMTGRGRPGFSGPIDGDGRRSIYLAVRRNFLDPMFLAFDYPTPFTTAGRRSASNVPAQALALLNDPFVLQQSRNWALRSTPPSAKDCDAAIESLYKSAFARQPTSVELSAARTFLAAQMETYGREQSTHAWTDLCHVLINTKEFIYVR